MPDLDIKNPRKQARGKRSAANVSLTWDTYERLDKLAAARSTSIGKVIDGLIKFHEDYNK